jgi:phenylacetate-CoA ligase
MLPRVHQLSAAWAAAWHARCDPERVRAFQADRLARLLNHAYRHVPLYRRLFDGAGVRPQDIRGPADLCRLPALSRRDMQALPLADRLAHGTALPGLVPHATSGSSGERFTAYHAPWELHLHRLFLLRAFRAAGLRSGDRLVRIWRTANRHRADPFRKRVTDALGFYARSEIIWPQPVDQVIEQLVRARPDVVRASPGALLRMARRFGERPPPALRPRLLIADGEQLTPPARRFIEEVFDVPVHDIYGCTELTLVAWPCPACRRWLGCDDSLVIEVVAGDRPARPGERGEVIATSLHSCAMPVIRYRTGDLVIQGSATCPGGLPFSHLDRFFGRASDTFHFPGGRSFHPAVIGDALADDPWILDYRVRQEDGLRLTVEAVGRRPPAADDLDRIRQKAMAVTDPYVRVDVMPRTDLDLEPSGKLRRYLPRADLDPGDCSADAPARR